MAWYDAGTVKVTINSATVTGTGTQWLAGARQGEAFVAPDGRLYEVLNIASNTSLTLTKPYLGATATGQKYALAPMQGYVKESADRLAALLLFLQTDLASVLKAADLQATPNDVTKDKILVTGKSFGLGSTGADSAYDKFPSASINGDGVPSGLYWANSTVADLPTGFGSGLLIHRQIGTTGAQILINGSTGVMFYRGRAASAWLAWKTSLAAGDHGIGGAQVSPPNGRASSNPTGWYYASGAAPSFGGGAFFLDLAYNATAINSGLRISTDPYTDNFYMNGAVSGKKEYRLACKLLHDKNIVGDVGAGSVMAVGSNANGTWVKFADGTQICYGVQSFPGNGWSRKTWTYPLEFYSTPVVTASGQGSNGGFASAPLVEPWTREVYFTKVNGSPENDSWANFACIAIGRWKA